MTITAVRLRPGFAWAGIGFLVVQTVFWAGPGALGTIGVIGQRSWVGVAHIITNALAKAARDSQRFALAEREATEWQAAQEAHLNERQFRLGQTSVDGAADAAHHPHVARATSRRRSARSACTSRAPSATRSADASCSTTRCASR